MQPTSVSRIVTFYSFADLEVRLRELLGSGNFDVVIHAAAVSDFSVASVETADGEALAKTINKMMETIS